MENKLKELQDKYGVIYNAKHKEFQSKIIDYFNLIINTDIKRVHINKNYLTVYLDQEFLNEIMLEYSVDYNYENRKYSDRNFKINWASVGSTNNPEYLNYVIEVGRMAQLIKDESELLEPVKQFFDEYEAIEKDEQLVILKTEIDAIKEQISTFKKEQETKRYLEICTQGYVESPTKDRGIRVAYGASSYDYGFKFGFTKNPGKKTYTLTRYNTDENGESSYVLKDNVKGEYIDRMIKMVIHKENELAKQQLEAK